MQNSKWLAKLGGWGYDMLILLNRGVNYLLEKSGRGKFSLSKKIKNSVKGAVSFISKVEQTAAEMAIYHGYDLVICGHIHQPTMQMVTTPLGQVSYYNAGDWVENLTALEYDHGVWRMFQYEEALQNELLPRNEIQVDNVTTQALFQQMWQEFQPAMR